MFNNDDAILSLDVETGGLDSDNHSLLSIGLVFYNKENNNNPLCNSWEINIAHDTYHLSSEALKINQINIIEHEKQKNIMTPQRAVQEFFEIVAKHYQGKGFIVLGHNPDFDISFIKKFINKYNSNQEYLKFWDSYFSYRTINTSTIGKFLTHTDLAHKDLSKSKEFFDWFTEDVEFNQPKHTALGDAQRALLSYLRAVDRVKNEVFG